MLSQILLVVAVLSTAVIYGTDMFHAFVVKKAASLSSGLSIADLMGHTHLVADKRMPFIGISAVLSTLLLTVFSYDKSLGIFSGVALAALISHLAIYLTIAKPVNTKMSSAAVEKTTPADIRALQARWDSVIVYRAILLTVAMMAIIGGIFAYGDCNSVVYSPSLHDLH